jgi:hypothetical protein
VSPGPRVSFEEAAFGLLALASAVPLFVAEYIPLQDLPQHAAAVRVLTDYSDSALRFRELFELRLLSTPYWSVYALSSLLSFGFGPLVALKLVLAASLVALPYTLRALLRELGKPGAYALLALPLAYNSQLALGFLNFVAGLPLMLLGLSLAARSVASQSKAAARWLSLVACVTFFSHVVPFVVLAGGCFVFAAGRDLRQVAARLLPLVPAALAASIWLTAQPSGRLVLGLASERERARASFVDFGTALGELPLWLTDIYRDGSGRWPLLALSLLVLAICVASFCGKGRVFGLRPDAARAATRATESLRRRLLLLLVLLVPAYFLLPAGYDWIWPLNARLPIVIALLGIAALPALGRRGSAAVGLAAAALAFGALALSTRAFRATSAEYAGLARALAQIPPGRAVVGLIFRPTSAVLRFAPHLHAAAWYQAERGGAVVFSFADFPQSPFGFRADAARPRLPPRWEWQPERVDTTRDLGWFDFVLSRGAPAVLPGWVPRYRENQWSVWSKAGSEP